MIRLSALLALFALPATALDPRFAWETLETPHFQVHYHQGMYRYAQKAARAAELSYARLVPLLDHVPEARTNLVVQDDTDFANGNATPLLYNLIHAYAARPIRAARWPTSTTTSTSWSRTSTRTSSTSTRCWACPGR
ncbi:MAG TPA: hypothetical protein VFP52_05890 [Myxococcales bacterium]|nr:hypothetical protein [Myxococcales bacterium]